MKTTIDPQAVRDRAAQLSATFATLAATPARPETVKSPETVATAKPPEIVRNPE